ncbi:DUF6318 family protein [Cellulosimicrobium sp. ES-005]|uniref:DUF6318 family protein n=1 Tax=Cellulosimicrobium sp. ES-005 TaxID=3163031 RepID=A0AAU8G638_9MICO
MRPERPAAMDRDDAEGAGAAATYFLTLYPYIMSTGDTSEWDAMTWAETCTFCTANSQTAAQLKADEQTYEGGSISAQVSKIWPYDDLAGAYPVDVSYGQEGATLRAADGAAIATYEPKSGVAEFGVARSGGSWVIVEVGGAS